MVDIAISGGAGFIGKHLIRTLMRRHPDAKVKVLDSFSDQVHGPDAESRFTEEFPPAKL